MRLRVLVGLLVILIVVPVAAQDGRINPSVLDIAIYCANGGVEIWDVSANGQGQRALGATRDQIGNAVGAARDNNAPVTFAQGSFGTSLTALPGVQLQAAQQLEDKNPFTYTFNADTCGPLNIPAPGTANVGNFAPGVLVDDTAAPVTPEAPAPQVGTTQNVLYTVQRGDTLNRIAQNFNVSVPEIVAANNLPNPNQLFPGQQLVIPNQVVEAPAPAEGNNPAPEENTAPALVNNDGNFLRDSSFEGQYTNRGRADFNVPSEWGIQVITEPRVYEWQNLIPVAFPHTTWVIRNGAASLNMNKGYATFTVVLSQQVSVPADATLEGSVWAWYHTCDAGSQNCDNRSNPVVRVGLAPDGGTNPFASNVTWSGNTSPQGSWGLVGVQGQAAGDVVTMFIFASQDTPRAINELYFDEAVLRQVS